MGGNTELANLFSAKELAGNAAILRSVHTKDLIYFSDSIKCALDHNLPSLCHFLRIINKAYNYFFTQADRGRKGN